MHNLQRQQQQQQQHTSDLCVCESLNNPTTLIVREVSYKYYQLHASSNQSHRWNSASADKDAIELAMLACRLLHLLVLFLGKVIIIIVITVVVFRVSTALCLVLTLDRNTTIDNSAQIAPIDIPLVVIIQCQDWNESGGWTESSSSSSAHMESWTRKSAYLSETNQ